MSISIVDDNNINCYILKEFLQEHYTDIKIFDCPLKFIEYTKLNKNFIPKIVLTDIMMPEMNGFDLCKIIREKYPESRVLGITAMPPDITLDICGMEKVFFKPFNIDELLNYLEIKK